MMLSKNSCFNTQDFFWAVFEVFTADEVYASFDQYVKLFQDTFESK
jgi:hypothetical protein